MVLLTYSINMNYRCILETLKFSSPKDVARQYLSVSTVWQQASTSSELWWEFCQARRLEADYLSAFSTPYEAFKSLKSTNFLVYFSEIYEQLCWYDCVRRKCANAITFLRTDVVQENSQCVLLGDMSLVVCGGGPAPNSKVYRVSPTGHVQSLPRLITPRLFFGLVHFKAKLYVFGGQSTKAELSSSESLVPTAVRWFPAGTMISSRSLFNPCGCGNRVYLCGGNTDQCEVFDYQEKAFFPLSFTLSEGGPACAFMENEQLIVLQTSFASRLDVRHMSEIVTTSKCISPAYLAMRPVVVGTQYFVLEDCTTQVKIYNVASHTYCMSCARREVIEVTTTIDAEFNVVRKVVPVVFK